jgi:1-acyl-sn-glycerol-3-phosphate acyltransferase
MMQKINSILFTVIFVFLWTLLWSIIMLPFSLLVRQIGIWVGRAWGFVVLWGLKKLCNLDYSVQGAQHISKTPVIYAMKHQSAWETFLVNILLDNASIVLKQELIYVPIVGLYFIILGCIPVKRSDGRKALINMVNAAHSRVLDEGRSVFIFPEGHRMDVGAEPHYQPGVAALYKDLNIPVVPIAHNSGVFWKRRSIFKKPGTVLVELLPPIQPGLDRKEFMKILMDAIETKTNELVAIAEGKNS